MADLLNWLADLPAFYFFAAYSVAGVVCVIAAARFLHVAGQCDEGESDAV